MIGQEERLKGAAVQTRPSSTLRGVLDVGWPLRVALNLGGEVRL